MNVLIDGGMIAHLSRCLCYVSPTIPVTNFIYRGNNYIRTPSVIVGEYYFKEFIENHPWFQPSNPLSYLSYPFCNSNRRKLYFAYLTNYSITDEPIIGEKYNTLFVHSNGHLLDIRVKPFVQVFLLKFHCYGYCYIVGSKVYLTMDQGSN